MRNGRVLVAVANKFNHPAAVSFSLMTWGDCQIHQFILPVSFFRNYGNGNRRVSAIEHGKHVAAFQIAVDHRFLLVAQQEQGEETFLSPSIFRISIEGDSETDSCAGGGVGYLRGFSNDNGRHSGGDAFESVVEFGNHAVGDSPVGFQLLVECRRDGGYDVAFGVEHAFFLETKHQRDVVGLACFHRHGGSRCGMCCGCPGCGAGG